jgi:hypothetical protein
MLLWSRSEGLPVRRLSGTWRLGEIRGSVVKLGGVQVVGAQQAAIPPALGGNVRDVEARATLDRVLEALREHGLVARNAE